MPTPKTPTAKLVVPTAANKSAADYVDKIE